MDLSENLDSLKLQEKSIRAFIKKLEDQKQRLEVEETDLLDLIK